VNFSKSQTKNPSLHTVHQGFTNKGLWVDDNLIINYISNVKIFDNRDIAYRLQLNEITVV